ncbi:MAG: ribosome biogenesis protein [Thermoprotei archaeon ex4572_64]|nr:MAG: ribosome biogenesis protein [Thermoprotei archaeon ex4572_64]
MVKSIMMKCRECKRYTLSRDKCPYCGGVVETPHPPKASPDDRFLKYRFLMKILSGKVQVSDDVRKKILQDLSRQIRS